MNYFLPLFHNYTYQVKLIKLYLSGRSYLHVLLIMLCLSHLYLSNMSTSGLPSCITIYTFQAGVLMIYPQVKQLNLHLY